MILWIQRDDQMEEEGGGVRVDPDEPEFLSRLARRFFLVMPDEAVQESDVEVTRDFLKALAEEVKK